MYDAHRFKRCVVYSSLKFEQKRQNNLHCIKFSLVLGSSVSRIFSAVTKDKWDATEQIGY